MKRHLALAALAGAAASYALTWLATHGHRCPRCGEDEIHVALACDPYERICPDCEDGGGDGPPTAPPDDPGGISRGISRRRRHRTPYNRRPHVRPARSSDGTFYSLPTADWHAGHRRGIEDMRAGRDLDEGAELYAPVDWLRGYDHARSVYEREAQRRQEAGAG